VNFNNKVNKSRIIKKLDNQDLNYVSGGLNEAALNKKMENVPGYKPRKTYSKWDPKFSAF